MPDTEQRVKDWVDRWLKALRHGGFEEPIRMFDELSLEELRLAGKELHRRSFSKEG